MSKKRNLIVNIDPDTDAFIRRHAADEGLLLSDYAGQLLDDLVALIRQSVREQKRESAIEAADRYRDL